MAGYVLPLHRADALMFGVLLALAWQAEKGKEFLHKHAVAFRWSCFFLFLVVAYLTYKKTWIGDAWGHFWLALFYCNFIVLALIQNDRAGKFNPFNSKILEWFGLRSYGIYLFHRPVQVLIPFVLGGLLHQTLSPWIVILICTIVLFAVSEVSYRFLEKPIMLWGHRFKYEQALPVDRERQSLDSAVAADNP
jgi:peptidoglycan/LPS O-acetylase OafA/YrhL